MALIVQLNTYISSQRAGTIQGNYGFWDPLSGVNLTKGSPTSGDLSGLSSAALQNIANAVAYGVLSVTSGTLPISANQSYSTYSLYSTAGQGPAVKGGGLTTVAAQDTLQPKNIS